MKSGIFMGLALVCGTLGLAACGSGESEAPADATPDGFPGVTVSNARLVLNAVKGNPAAAYFDVAYKGGEIAVIRAVSVAGAGEAMLHTKDMTELLPPKVEDGTTFKFEPGGNHVMVDDVPDTLQPGGTVEITITFLGGDKTSFPAEVRAAGDAD